MLFFVINVDIHSDCCILSFQSHVHHRNANECAKTEWVLSCKQDWTCLIHAYSCLPWLLLDIQLPSIRTCPHYLPTMHSQIIAKSNKSSVNMYTNARSQPRMHAHTHRRHTDRPDESTPASSLHYPEGRPVTCQRKNGTPACLVGFLLHFCSNHVTGDCLYIEREGRAGQLIEHTYMQYYLYYVCNS